MSVILFYARDPGGANAVKPLIEPLKNKGYEVFVFGAGAALKILPDITEFEGDTDGLINKIKPDFVITGTSADCMTEKKLRKSAKNAGIQCLSVSDAWVNYNRFTPYSCSELRKNKKYNELEYLPDYVIVMDEAAKKGSIEEGVPESVIYTFGNPHFKYIKDAFEKLDISKLRNSLLQGKEKLALWASECLIEDYGAGMELESLKDIISIIPDNVQLIVKPHPREKENKFDGFKDIKNITIIKDKTSQELIKSSDIVMSMTSMVLTEALIAAKPVISYQKGEKDRNKFILTKIGALPFINDKITLEKEFKNRLEKNIKSDFKIKFDAAEKIIEFIEDKLCRKQQQNLQ